MAHQGGLVQEQRNNTTVDFAYSNLHIVNYCVPIHEVLSFEELRPGLHALSPMPEAIPYRTTYYDRSWGFCLSAETLNEIDASDNYELCIDSSVDPERSLTYAGMTIDGDSDRKYLLPTYHCHSRLANDNLSEPILATLLFERIRRTNPYHSYRLVIAPETIGILSYLQENEAVDEG